MIGLEMPRGFWLESVDSTMDEARRLIQSGKIQGVGYVVANHQTHGRGTRGRPWLSPANQGIYLSVVHHPPEGVLKPTTLYTFAAGVACVEAIRGITGIEVSLKPVNDIYVGGSKLGGILVESDLNDAGITSLITGVGINTHRWASEPAVPLAVSPVSVEALLPPEDFLAVDWDSFVETLVAKICFWHGLVFEGHTGQIERAWEEYQCDVVGARDS